MTRVARAMTTATKVVSVEESNGKGSMGYGNSNKEGKGKEEGDGAFKK
jgi:hypothetical protein